MINLSFIFDDAVNALNIHPDRLTVVQLPAAVYMMQVDVINHYRHALSNHLTLRLDNASLQNSSLGTPYQKWAFFANNNFATLSFMVDNLLRYSSRLVHDAGCMARGDGRDGSDYWRKSNTYMAPLCQMRLQGNSIGIRVSDDQHLVITRIRTAPHPVPVIMRGTHNGPAMYVRIVKDAEGTEREEPTDEAEFDRAEDAMEVETIDISDRSRLESLRERGLAEIADLAERNQMFCEACNTFYASRKVAKPFRTLNESY